MGQLLEYLTGTSGVSQLEYGEGGDGDRLGFGAMVHDKSRDLSATPGKGGQNLFRADGVVLHQKIVIEFL